MKIDYNSPIELKRILDENEMAMQKKFGQNFLINENARKKIADSLEIKEGTTVWEIGPGLGAMTAEILTRGASVTVFEIDRGFARLLRTIFEQEISEKRLRIVEGDVLKTWKNESSLLPERFFGNLPYNAAAQIIASTIESMIQFDKMVVTVQKEVAERMSAKENSANRSSFSVLCQWAYDIKTVSDLAGGSFWPVPNVASRCVSLSPKKDFPSCRNPALFREIVRELFASRRKTVRNNLLSHFSAEKVDSALNESKIAPSERAENLSLENLLLLSDLLSA